MTEENHCILIYILDDCSFSIIITFFLYQNAKYLIIKLCIQIQISSSQNAVFQKRNTGKQIAVPATILMDLHGMEHYEMNISYRKKHTVFFLELEEIFRWNPQHQFWLIYTEWHIMEWLFYTYKPSVFYLNFWKFPGTSLIDLHGISHAINILYSKRHNV